MNNAFDFCSFFKAIFSSRSQIPFGNGCSLEVPLPAFPRIPGRASNPAVYPAVAKSNFADKDVPKWNLGTRVRRTNVLAESPGYGTESFQDSQNKGLQAISNCSYLYMGNDKHKICNASENKRCIQGNARKGINRNPMIRKALS